MNTRKRLFKLCVTLSIGISTSNGWASGETCQDVFSLFKISSDEAAFLKEEIPSRIDNLIKLQIQLSQKDFPSDDQFRQALHFFEKEMQGLSKVLPNFSELYRKRYTELKSEAYKSQREKQLKQSEHQKQKQSASKESLILSPVLKKKIYHEKKTLVSDLAYSHNNQFFASASWDGHATITDTNSYNEIFNVKHKDWINNILFSFDDKYLLTSSADGTAKLTEVSNGKTVLTIKHKSGVNHAEFSHDGRYILTASSDKTARISEIVTKNGFFSTGLKTSTLFEIPHNSGVTHASFDPIDKLVTTTTSDGKVSIYDLATQGLIFSFTHPSAISSLFYNHDGSLLFTASIDGKLKITDTVSHQTVMEKKFDGGIRHAILSNNEQFISVSTNNGSYSLYDLKTGMIALEIIPKTDISKGRVYTSIFSHDDKLIFTASDDRLIQVTSLETGQELLSISSNRTVDRLALSRDGSTLATGDLFGETQIFDLFQKLGSH